jgi:hypothetical protein
MPIILSCRIPPKEQIEARMNVWSNRWNSRWKEKTGLRNGDSVVAIMVLISLLSLLAFSGSALGQGTLQWTVTFDGQPTVPPGWDIGVTNYYEHGIKFTPLRSGDQFGRAGGGVPGFPEDGSAYLIAGLGDSLAVSSVNGAPFGLVSVDLAEFSTFYPYPKTVQFGGYLTDGKTVTTEFTTDGIIDGTGPLADFQTFYFDSQFADVVRVEVPGYGWSLDNMVFRTVPEPSTCALMILGGALAALRFFKPKP